MGRALGDVLGVDSADRSGRDADSCREDGNDGYDRAGVDGADGG